jgi:hypothetical protein
VSTALSWWVIRNPKRLLESSLIGVPEVKLLLLFSLLAVDLVPVGYSLLFAVGALAAAWWGQKSEASQSVSRPSGLAPFGSGLSTGSPCPSSPRGRFLPLARIIRWL